ncbi:MAG TPA: hypothetical protein VJQ55_07510, partial [Candidatus Binatia bacterium]|nr:hypothetical protein [Candidatus Binatia bacterium]
FREHAGGKIQTCGRPDLRRREVGQHNSPFPPIVFYLDCSRAPTKVKISSQALRTTKKIRVRILPI